VALMNRMTEALERYAAPEPVELQSMLKALRESAESTRRTGDAASADTGSAGEGSAGPAADGPADEVQP
jgi:hypothetical protein